MIGALRFIVALYLSICVACGALIALVWVALTVPATAAWLASLLVWIRSSAAIELALRGRHLPSNFAVGVAIATMAVTQAAIDQLASGAGDILLVLGNCALVARIVRTSPFPYATLRSRS